MAMSEEQRQKELQYIAEMQKSKKKEDTRSVRDIISVDRKAEQVKSLAPEKNADEAMKQGAVRQDENMKAIQAAKDMKEKQRKMFGNK